MGTARLIPLGGLGEFGLNALALESDTDLVVVDSGLLFPAPGTGGDCLVPDFSYLGGRREKLRGILLTHGHDDHVGALPHLLREFPQPVYGTALTLGLVEGRLREELPSARGLLHRVGVGESVGVGRLRAHFLRVAHSVPDSAALALETPGGTVLHTGDFKLDPSPVDGIPTDEASLTAWGSRGVDLLCCDSTNAHRPGVGASERAVGAALRRILGNARGRVYIVTFSSHAHRVQQVLTASREAGRTVALLGRTLRAAVQVARRLGHVHPAPGDLVPERHLDRQPRHRQTVLLPGSQGEEGSAFFRVARGLEPRYRVEPGDDVVFSARRIPGNEAPIDDLIGRCLRQGARVHWDEGAGVHVSGHGCASELTRMLELTRPRHLLPVHGELRHLDSLARLATAWGMPAEAVFRVENGQSLVLEGGTVRLGPAETTGRILWDRGLAAPAGDPLLRDRSRLGREGIALATLWASAGRGREVRVSLRGVVPAAEQEAAEIAAEAVVRRHLTDHPPDAGVSAAVGAASALRRHFRRLGGRRPIVEVVVAGCEPPASERAGGKLRTEDRSEGD
ncbi:MAG: ribonuclease J [Deltaproteobacteria bacterium]|nr:ribonuclease J [Deltaproteobacteria bacterium]